MHANLVFSPLPMRRFWPVALTALLAGCQTLSVAECNQGNWSEVGRRDGLEGRAPRYGQLLQECALQRATVLASAQPTYRAGHAEGLRVFCTAPVVLEKAVSTSVDLSVCPVTSIPLLTPYVQVGSKLRDAQKQLDSLRAERERLYRDLTSSKPAPTAQAQRLMQDRIWQLDRDLERQQYRLEKAEADLRYWREQAQHPERAPQPVWR